MGALTDFVDRVLSMIDPPLSKERLAEKLDAMAKTKNEALDWRTSIVDLMKLTNQDSSLESRKALAYDLGYSGPLDGSGAMNIWLHGKILNRLSKTLKH